MTEGLLFGLFVAGVSGLVGIAALVGWRGGLKNALHGSDVRRVGGIEVVRGEGKQRVTIRCEVRLVIPRHSGPRRVEFIEDCRTRRSVLFRSARWSAEEASALARMLREAASRCQVPGLKPPAPQTAADKSPGSRR